ncbi:HyaD/HybD family hydrogenase maturation endopeptidase [soil metagenome]
MRSLIAGIGYLHLSDSSVGVVAAKALQEETWPDNVVVQELSYGPIGVMHTINEVSPPYDRMILITAADFGARPPAMRWSRWSEPLPDADEVQARIGEALSGVVDWKNLLVILQQFGALPPEVFVIAIQPVKTDAGIELTPGVEQLMPEVLRLARELASSETPEAVAESGIAH